MECTMIKGLYVAGTSMITNINKMDVISNNLANVNTTGFKKDRVEVESFNARLFTRINGSMLTTEPGAKDITQTTRGEEVTAETTKGYFRVQTENGIHYGKSVQFFKDNDGYLRTFYKNVGGTIDNLKGDLVLGNKGPIYVGEGTYELDDNGNMLVDGTIVDQMITMVHPSVVGTMSAGIRGYSVLTDHEQGQLEMTNNSFDLAIKGEGFFNIDVNGEILYSRNGAFTRNSMNELVTFEGHKVIGLNGPIYIDSDSFSVNAFGEVIQDGEITDKLTMTAFTNIADVYKVGTGYYRERGELTGEKVDFEGEIIQGFVEQSNTDAITEMIQLIGMNRNYETSQKVITTIDDMIAKSVTELGRV